MSGSHTSEELKSKMAEWLNRYNNRPHSSLKNREGKRAWQSPIQKRMELMEDSNITGNIENIRFLKNDIVINI